MNDIIFVIVIRPTIIIPTVAIYTPTVTVVIPTVVIPIFIMPIQWLRPLLLHLLLYASRIISCSTVHYN